MLFQTAVISTLLALAAALPEKRAATPNPTVTISSGVLVGTATRVSNQPTLSASVNAFIGVPYASNPPLRFAPPAAAKSWNGALTVQTNKPICLQQQSPGAVGEKVKMDFNNPVRGPSLVEAEACLYLSVYSPPGAIPAKADNLKTVMVWLYGGNLVSGGSAVNTYNGSSLAVTQDVVVVVPNYRTNIFGFSNSPDIPFGQQNSGFLDQRFALQWVQDNIAQFGGDPASVTLFGESAGGYSIKQLLANPPDPLTFRAAILESTGFASSGSGLDNYYKVAANFSCNATASTRLSCLRAVPATKIQNYIGSSSLSFPPVIGDGTSSGTHTNLNVDNNTFAKVPVMLGTNFNEARIFESELGIDNSTAVVDGVLAVTGINVNTAGINISGLYPSAVAQLNYAIIDRIATDLVFTCPASLLAAKLKNRQPVWRYRYDGVFPDVSVYPNVGAYHSSEIFEVFGTYPLKNQFGSATADQIALAQYMQGAWATFAKNPSGGPGWNKYGSDVNDLAVLGGINNTGGLSQQNPFFTADYPCLVFDPYLLLSGTAY